MAPVAPGRAGADGQQTAILESAARLVKPGGRLVYATCSVLPEENEAIAQAFGAAHADFEPLAAGELLARLRWNRRPACAAAVRTARPTCAFGRICTRQAVSSLPCGSANSQKTARAGAVAVLVRARPNYFSLASFVLFLVVV